MTIHKKPWYDISCCVLWRKITPMPMIWQANFFAMYKQCFLRDFAELRATTKVCLINNATKIQRIYGNRLTDLQLKSIRAQNQVQCFWNRLSRTITEHELHTCFINGILHRIYASLDIFNVFHSSVFIETNWKSILIVLFLHKRNAELK